MGQTYESQAPEARSERIVHAIVDEYLGLEPIETLDEYIHYHDQLIAMRKRSPDFVPEGFAMEVAVLFLLNDYDRRIGIPELPMPSAQQNETPVERIVPEDWVG